MTTLSDLQIGDSARVTGYEDKRSPFRRRLLAMGLTPGAVIKVVRLAPLGDPIELSLRGAAVSVRRDEARVVAVEPIA